jgi:hypothetical protein
MDTTCHILHKNALILVWARWCMPINPAFRRLKQEDLKFRASLGYTV